MKKFYKDPEAEILEIDASIATGLNDSGELDGDDYNKGDGIGIGGLTGGGN